MGSAHKPRSGSLQYWPRKRAKKEIARVKAWANVKEAKLLGFAGYKVGMTHIIATDNNPNSQSKGDSIFIPVTVIECPPLKAASIRFYKNKLPVSQIVSQNIDKELERRIKLTSKKKIEDIKEYDNLRLIVYTQPKLTTIGKKKPELFEMELGGKKEDKLKYAQSILGKEINVDDIFKEGNQIDLHAVTKGKGFQGPVKRYGVKIKSHKSEKTKRGVGNLGAWTPKYTSYTVGQPGKMGYHLRTEYNKWLLKIGTGLDQKGGFKRYGLIKNTYVLLKGSVPGPVKRLIRFNVAVRQNKLIPAEIPTIEYVSTTSKQGN